MWRLSLDYEALPRYQTRQLFHSPSQALTEKPSIATSLRLMQISISLPTIERQEDVISFRIAFEVSTLMSA